MCGKQTGMFYFVISLKGLIRIGFPVVIPLRVIMAQLRQITYYVTIP